MKINQSRLLTDKDFFNQKHPIARVSSRDSVRVAYKKYHGVRHHRGRLIRLLPCADFFNLLSRNSWHSSIYTPTGRIVRATGRAKRVATLANMVKQTAGRYRNFSSSTKLVVTTTLIFHTPRCCDDDGHQANPTRRQTNTMSYKTRLFVWITNAAITSNNLALILSLQPQPHNKNRRISRPLHSSSCPNVRG